MKKQIALYVAAITLALGIATPAYAQHCDAQKGDSMWRIAQRYHVVFSEVLKLNKKFKNPNMIFPKDEIELPDGSQGTGSNNSSSNDNINSGNSESVEPSSSEQANQVLKLVNVERSKQGLKALTLSKELTSIANTKAKDMAVNRYFDHRSPTYGSPFEMLQQFGVSYKTAGENIAAGQKTAEQVMNSWMNSSGHKANILSKSFTELGVGYYNGGSYGTYWVQLFIGK